MNSTPRRPQAFAASAANPETDKSFVGKLVFFSGIADHRKYGALNHTLALFHTEEISEDPGERDMVMGYVVNNPTSVRLRDLFNNPANNSLRQSLSFPHILDSTVEKLSPEDDSLTDLVTFLTTHRPDIEFVSKSGIRAHNFAGFSAYSCDHVSQIHEVASHINKHPDVLMLRNQFLIEKIVLERMIEQGKAHLRDASPEALFYPSPNFRASIAFPDDVPKFMRLE